MTIKKAKEILGKDAEKFTDYEISEMISFLEILAEVTINNIKNDILKTRLIKEVN